MADNSPVLITGITGQDGSYLAESLLSEGRSVHGTVRRSSDVNRSRIEHLREAYPGQLNIHYSDLADATHLRRLISGICPGQIYHLAGQSHVGLSFDIPESTFNEVAGATLSLLEICRDMENSVKVLLIGSSEVFGNSNEAPQSETTPFVPTSPYGCAKSFVLQLGKVYRDSFGLNVSTVIPYNHESVRRGFNFVTKKITSTAVRILKGSQDVIELGNLNSMRDWGYAPEYVDGFKRAVESGCPDDFILATGTSASVREYALAAFEALGMPIKFEGEGEAEVARDLSSGRIVIRVNSKYCRPNEPRLLVGDSSKAEEKLGWVAKTKGVDVARVIAMQELEIFESRKAV